VYRLIAIIIFMLPLTSLADEVRLLCGAGMSQTANIKDTALSYDVRFDEAAKTLRVRNAAGSWDEAEDVAFTKDQIIAKVELGFSDRAVLVEFDRIVGLMLTKKKTLPCQLVTNTEPLF
jgi:hypothetical protein